MQQKKPDTKISEQQRFKRISKEYQQLQQRLITYLLITIKKIPSKILITIDSNSIIERNAKW